MATEKSQPTDTVRPLRIQTVAPKMDLSLRREEMEFLYLRLDRVLVRFAFRLRRLVVRLLRQDLTWLTSEEIQKAQTEDDVVARLRWLHKQKDQWLTRWMLSLHETIDDAQGLKEVLTTALLWWQVFRRSFVPAKRYCDYKKWIEMHETETADLSTLRKVQIYLWLPERRTWKKQIRIFAKNESQNARLNLVVPAKDSADIQKFAGKLGMTERVRLIEHETAKESLLQIFKSDCDLLIFLTGRSYVFPQRVAAMVREFTAHPSWHLAYADEDRVSLFGKRKQPIFHSKWDLDYVASQNPFRNGVIMRREEVRKCVPKVPLDGMFWDFVWLCVRSQMEEDQQAAEKQVSLWKRPLRVGHIEQVGWHAYSICKAEEDVEWQNATQKFMQTWRDGLKYERGLRGKWQLTWPWPTQEPKVSFLIPVKDQVHRLEPLLEGLLRKTDYELFEIILMDNGSNEPETRVYFNKLQKDTRVKIVGFHRPFHAGSILNFGVQHAQGDVLVFMGNNVEILQPQWLKSMVAEALRPEVGAVGCKLVYMNQFVESGGIRVRPEKVIESQHQFEYRTSRGYEDRLLMVQEVDAVSGSTMVMRRKVWEQLRGFNENEYVQYFGDVDFCLRAREQGYKVIWVPQSEVAVWESPHAQPSWTKPKLLRQYRAEFESLNQTWQPKIF